MPEIMSGGPVYFNFTEYMISTEVASVLGLSNLKDGYDEFLKAVKSFLDVNGNKVDINPSVYSQQGPVSNVILIIAIQVLAAEFMAKEEGQYTQSAYFPQLRKMISPDIGIDSLLPFKENEFRDIWSKFKEEVLHINPESFITFDVSGKGSNINRIYPLSQALLNQEDLIKLASTFYLQGRKLTVDSPDFNWRSFLISNSRQLSRRGYSCCVNDSLRLPAIEQLSYFIKTYSPQQILSFEDKLKKIDNFFRITLFDNSDDIFFGESEAARQVIYNRDDAILEGSNGIYRIIKYFESKNYLVLRTFEGAYRGDPKATFEDRLDNLCFIAKDEGFRNFIEASLGLQDLILKKTNIEGCDQYSMYYLADIRTRDINVTVINGNLALGKSLPKFSFVGGIRLDYRALNYFAEFPPSGIQFNGRRVSGPDSIVVNNKKIQCSEFFDLLGRFEDASFVIEYSGELTTLNLRRASRNIVDIGYLVDKRSVISKKHISNPDQAAIIGFSFLNFDKRIHISRGDFLKFFIQEKELFTSINDKELEHLSFSIQKTNELGATQKLFMIQSLKALKLAPVSLLQRLQDSTAHM